MISFFVPGIPATQGSKRPFVNKATGKALVVESNKRNKPWRADVREAALAVAPEQPIEGPVSLEIAFRLPRPKYHYKKSGELKDSAPRYHDKKPDASKLVRAVEDALKGILWKDDSQVALSVVSKLYVKGCPGAAVRIETL